MTAKAVLEVRSSGHEHQDPSACDPVETEFDEFKCCSVDPMRIFEHEEDRLAARQPDKLVDERLHCADPLLLWRQAQGSVTRFGLQSKESGNERPIALGADQHLFQTVELIVIIVVVPEPGSEGQLLNNRIKRQIGVIWRTLTAHPYVYLRRDRIDHAARKARLADAGLAR